MFTTVAWSASADQAAITAIAAVADPHLTVQGNDVRVPSWATKLYAVYANGVNLTQAQLNSPSLRRFVPYDIDPIDRAATPSNPTPLIDMFDNPYEFDVDESLNALTSEDGAGATRMNVIAWLGDGNKEQVSGEILTVRVTSATAAVAFAWTNVALTFTNVLPAGRYAIVGLRGISTTGIACRLVLSGSGYRPGALMQTAEGRVRDLGQRFRWGRAGKLGEFRNTTPPTIDVFAGAADATQTFWLDLIQLGQ